MPHSGRDGNREIVRQLLANSNLPVAFCLKSAGGERTAGQRKERPLGHVLSRHPKHGIPSATGQDKSMRQERVSDGGAAGADVFDIAPKRQQFPTA